MKLDVFRSDFREGWQRERPVARRAADDVALWILICMSAWLCAPMILPLLPLLLIATGWPAAWHCADLWATRGVPNVDPLSEHPPARVVGRACGRLAGYLPHTACALFVWPLPLVVMAFFGPGEMVMPALAVCAASSYLAVAANLLAAAWALFLGVQTRRSRQFLVTAAAWLFTVLQAVLVVAASTATGPSGLGALGMPPSNSAKVAMPRALAIAAHVPITTAILLWLAWRQGCQRYAGRTSTTRTDAESEPPAGGREKDGSPEPSSNQ